MLSASIAAVNGAATFHIRFALKARCRGGADFRSETAMNGLIYLVGLIVVILAILSFLGLH
jgi:hypothetical protein